MIPVRDYLSLLSSNLEGLGRRVVALVVALLAGIALQLVNPQLLRSIIDGALAGEPTSALVPLAATFVAVALPPRSWRSSRRGWPRTSAGGRPTACAPT